MSSSAILVHLSGGYIEFHFHFFVMLTFLALCQNWIPYLLAVAFVALHHGVVGVLWPHEVYNHEAAFNSPWTWAGIHAVFVLWSCVGTVVAWRFNERAFAQTALILEAAGEGIFGLDTEGRITFMNPAAARMLGVNPRAPIGKPIDQFVHHLGTDGTPLPSEASIFAPLGDRATRQGSDQIFARPDGSYIPVDYVSTPMIERDELTGVVVSFNDITERHRSEAALQRSHRRLEETLAQLKTTQRQVLQQERLRAMGQMASDIAHDFNNPLSPIVGFAELLLRHPDLPTAQSYVQLINTAAHDAASIIRRLRELYRERAETVAEVPVDLRQCIDEIVALTQPRWKNEALGRGVTIHVETDVADVPVVQADAPAIREMLANLIFNAVDAMPAGGTITVSARGEGARVRLEVKDTGEIESAPGRGTSFIVRLPVQGRAGVTRADAAAPQPPRGLRVLVVEDEPMVRMGVVAQLGSEGHVVDSAANGREALDKFMSGRFDLIVTDRAMPEMGGDELAAAIERLSPNTPVIMLTGFGDLMEAKGEHPAGVDVVVGKPVTLDALADAIRQVSGRGDR